MADSVGEENVNMPQTPEPAHVRTPQREPSKRRKLGKKLREKLREKTVEAQVAAFKAWRTPHRTDEHITPGIYSRFWKGLARCFTFYIPSWFLKSFFKMYDLRRRLAFRQKVLFYLVLTVVYGLVSYFLVIQPLLSCVTKVHIGMIPKDSSSCRVVSYVIYVYMGLVGAFMLLVAFCVGRVRYTSRAFEEHNAMLVMHIPCYDENEPVLRKTIDSCVDSRYEKDRKLLFIVLDGNMAAEGEEKPTHRILLEDIFHHTADLELGIDDQAQPYASFDSNGGSDNLAFCYTGFYRGVPYMRTSLNMDASNATYMLVVDYDTEVQKTGISYLINQLQKDTKLVGSCGYTGVNNPTGSFVASSQVFEYWLTHAVLKAVETMCTNVLVPSGCFTIYRLKWPNNQPSILHPLLLEDDAGIYEKTLHEHNLLTIGEDRYLSTLAIRYFGSDCRLCYLSAAICTTTVPVNLTVLLDQRRRWTNSLIHCHFAHLNVLPFEGCRPDLSVNC
ncbi:unnamed protein product [Clonostachys rosea]|uniref:chitin synthase n=1 Tax=Bionectria ochroleuca TaxID=29856 RepID=A0ABY6U6Z9_BIOOC|nr:unnamed protein product [Clonostachys rosea]